MSMENYEKLGALYGQIYELSIIVGQLIDRKQFDNIDNYLNMKENLYTEAGEVLKTLGENPDLSEYYDICEKIQNQESSNITMLTVLRDELKNEMQKNNKKSKLVNAYSNVETKQGNLLDMRE